jgi:Holliday junction resolvase
MAQTPESKVKSSVTTILKRLGIYYFYPVTGGYGSSGVPDIVCCYNGVFVAIECKAGHNKPTPLQEAQMQKIRQAGGYTIVINEENVSILESWLLNLLESS